MELLSYCTIDETKEVDYSVENPLNREPDVKELISSFITPEHLSYDRNHGPIPHINPSKHFLRINGEVPNSYNLTIHQLATEFPQHEVTCALECAGNRRHTMRTMLREVDGIDWGDAAVMNCKWKGPRMRDVLLRAGVREDEAEVLWEREAKMMHVWLSSYQVKCQKAEWFGGSVELGRCMDVNGDVILALEMNGSPLPPNRGQPIRAIIPGISGSKWVKWLDRITIQDHESPNHYQRRDYRVLPPEATDKQTAEKYWSISPPLYDVPINSVIAVPGPNETIHLPESGSGLVEVKGYAVPHGADGPVTRVEVSVDKGRNWVEAALEEPGRSMRWCWVYIIHHERSFRRTGARGIWKIKPTTVDQVIWSPKQRVPVRTLARTSAAHSCLGGHPMLERC